MEWIDPIYIAGHWVPDMINIAGGKELYGKGGEKSQKLMLDYFSQKTILGIIYM